MTTRGVDQATAVQWLGRGRPVCVVEMRRVQGSAPRAQGTRMLVSESGLAGTIGGGHLELQAIRIARERLSADGLRSGVRERFALGPSLGQCCGGTVELEFTALDAGAVEAWPRVAPRFHLMLYGAGHVGRAVVSALSGIDCTVDWIDERDAEFAVAGDALPPHVRTLCVDLPAAEVNSAPANAFHLVMTHSHDLDQAICEAVLRRGDFAFLGLIGSGTKASRFVRRLCERGLAPELVARLTCPIGVGGIRGKEPAVIAVAVVAQLLQLS